MTEETRRRLIALLLDAEQAEAVECGYDDWNREERTEVYAGRQDNWIAQAAARRGIACEEN